LVNYKAITTFKEKSKVPGRVKKQAVTGDDIYDEASKIAWSEVLDQLVCITLPLVHRLKGDTTGKHFLPGKPQRIIVENLHRLYIY
jgi:hypothetical protein